MGNNNNGKLDNDCGGIFVFWRSSAPVATHGGRRDQERNRLAQTRLGFSHCVSEFSGRADLLCVLDDAKKCLYATRNDSNSRRDRTRAA